MLAWGFLRDAGIAPVAALLLVLAGCGADRAPTQYGGYARPDAETAGGEAASTGDVVRPSMVMDAAMLSAPAEESAELRYAQAAVPTTAPAPAAAPADPNAVPPQAPAEPEQGSAVMSDGRSGPLLIYSAQLSMAVYKVEETQQRAIALFKELGGFMTQHEDRTRLVLRVPAAQFYTAIERLEALGQIAQRHVSAQDVTDEFRDLELRLRNAEAMRDRLVTLLEKAPDVPQALAVEHHLDRISERIELLKGQLKAMGDRIAYSTIVIQFFIKREELIDPEFQLPFEWLRQLGLQHLLSLS